MKKIITLLSALLLLTPSITFGAVPVVFPYNGGSGWGAPGGITAGDLIIGNGLNPYATSSNLTFNSTANRFTTLNASTTVLSSLSSAYFATGGGVVGIGATSTPGSLFSIQGIANFTTATSTFYGNGLNLTNGCFAINSVCVGAGAGTVTSVAASVPSVLSISGSPITSSGTLAIGYSGTALPILNGGTNATSFTTTNNAVYYTGSALATAPATTAIIIPYASSTSQTISGSTYLASSGGSVGIGATTSPGSILSVQGVGNFTTATSTLYGNGVNLTNGCFAINGTCVGGSAGASTGFVVSTTSVQQLSTTTISFTSTGFNSIDFSFHASSTQNQGGADFIPQMYFNSYSATDLYAVDGIEILWVSNTAQHEVTQNMTATSNGLASLTNTAIPQNPGSSETLISCHIFNLTGMWIYGDCTVKLPQSFFEDNIMVRYKKASAGPLTSISITSGGGGGRQVFATSTVMTVHGY